MLNLLLFLLLHLHLTTATTTFYLNCGSSSASTNFSDDPRTFTPDSPYLTPSNSPALTTANNTLIASNYSSLYTTARLFTSDSTYTLPVSSSGTHVLRLHFYPFNSKLSTAKFTVYALQHFQLLANFSTTSLIVKEYFISADESQDFVIKFVPGSNSVGFVSAIELFTAPPEVFPNTSLVYTQNSAPQAWETVHRLNVGGPKINPNFDTLQRTWLTDDEYVIPPSSSSLESSVDVSSVKYTSGNTVNVAPVTVYSSARIMNISDYMRKVGFSFNVSWSLPVVSGYQYMIRLHFCDIVSLATEDTISFNVYVGDTLAFGNLNSRTITDDVREGFYKEWSAGNGEKYINVSIGASTLDSLTDANAYLNGLEVFKLNNSVASLDGSSNLLYDSSSRDRVHLVTILVPCVVGGLVLIGVAIVLLLFVRKRYGKRSPAVEPKDKPSSHSATPTTTTTTNSTSQTSKSVDVVGGIGASPRFNFELQIPLSIIIAVTNSFGKELVIGSGGFGKVYKGILEDGTEVAIKRGSESSKQGDPEFQTEITLLSKIRHKHLVSLVGYCDEQSERILVYEYMEKGPLSNHLYGSPQKPCLSWEQRLQICIGAAKGIHYLHTGFDTCIIHRDIKSTNILLDKDYSAKVADFGLSRYGPTPEQTHVSTFAKGTFGYMDPEYFKTGKLTDRSDVYSFGVMLFEVLCARPVLEQEGAREQLNLAEWAVHWYSRGQIVKIIDPRIAGKINDNSLRTFTEIAVKCLAEYGSDRPTFGDILWNLEYALTLQETEVRRQLHEDSGTVVPGTVAVPMMSMASVNSEAVDNYTSSISGRASDNNMALSSTNVAQTGLSESSVFSQLVIGDGR